MPHGDFFLQKVRARIDGELADDVPDHIVALADTHGIG